MVLILKKEDRTQAALLENNLLAEIFIPDYDDEDTVAGSIYVGKIEKFVNALEAAFVKIANDQNAFLRLKDIKSEYLKFFGFEKLQEGQKILVQIKKEGGLTKGPQVTTNIGIPGRYIVYMPFSKNIGISRRIIDEEDRKRLKQIGEILKEKYNAGFIMRTSAAECNEERIYEEVEELKKKWMIVVETFKRSRKPKLIYKETDNDEFMVREFLKKEVSDVITNSSSIKELVRNYRRDVNVKVVESDPFEDYNIYAQLKSSLRRVHQLPSGGEIVIDRTEALTIIDVNSGHCTNTENHEELSKKINAEAAKEICRLLRLRNIGGIIIIDFIDMEDDQSKDEIIRVLKDETLKDRNKIEIYGFTRLGLLEMTRKRTSKSLDERLNSLCPVCNGTGYVVNPKIVLEKLLKEINKKPKEAKEVIIKLHPSFKQIVDKELIKKVMKVTVHLHFTHTEPDSYELIWKV
ncbi:MAG: Rne/Rng family ribonuclease [Fervidobacterium sp.]|nr:Rne/Rng family ribonuclease [Fervidobacterium sp.]